MMTKRAVQNPSATPPASPPCQLLPPNSYHPLSHHPFCGPRLLSQPQRQLHLLLMVRCPSQSLSQCSNQPMASWPVTLSQAILLSTAILHLTLLRLYCPRPHVTTGIDQLPVRLLLLAEQFASGVARQCMEESKSRTATSQWPGFRHWLRRTQRQVSSADTKVQSSQEPPAQGHETGSTLCREQRAC